MTTAQPLANVHDICAHLGVSRQKVTALIEAGMPHLDLGPKTRRFNLDAVDEWASRSRVPS